MVTEQSIPQTAAATDRSRDLHSKLYRKIGISAVVAALEATKPMRNRKDVPSVLLRLNASAERRSWPPKGNTKPR